MFSFARTAAVAAACAFGSVAAGSLPTQNIVQLAASVPDLSILVELVVAGGLNGTLSGSGPFTVFAPSNEAFNALGNATLQKLLDPANKALLVDILTYHVVSADIHSKDLHDGETAATVEGDDVTVHINGGSVFINDAKVVLADVDATNGVVHVVDKVLQIPAPPQNIVQLAESVPDLSFLVQLVGAAGLVDILSGPGPFTVFAPTNEAFFALDAYDRNKLQDPAFKAQLVEILSYHVVAGDILAKDLSDGEIVRTVEGENVTVHINGSSVLINDAQVVVADVNASNGVVHIVDKVLFPAGLGPKNIVQLAQSVPDLSILVQLVVAAGLADTLSGTGPFTVFAPTNEAFNALGSATLQKLLDPANKALLVNILTYHVVSGRDIHCKDFKDGQLIQTADGQIVTVAVSPYGVTINGNSIFACDNDASNGVAHIIHSVLMPK